MPFTMPSPVRSAAAWAEARRLKAVTAKKLSCMMKVERIRMDGAEDKKGVGWCDEGEDEYGELDSLVE